MLAITLATVPCSTGVLEFSAMNVKTISYYYYCIVWNLPVDRSLQEPQNGPCIRGKTTPHPSHCRTWLYIRTAVHVKEEIHTEISFFSAGRVARLILVHLPQVLTLVSSQKLKTEPQVLHRILRSQTNSIGKHLQDVAFKAVYHCARSIELTSLKLKLSQYTLKHHTMYTPQVYGYGIGQVGPRAASLHGDVGISYCVTHLALLKKHSPCAVGCTKQTH